MLSIAGRIAEGKRSVAARYLKVRLKHVLPDPGESFMSFMRRGAEVEGSA